jgi:hypothetical protein
MFEEGIGTLRLLRLRYSVRQPHLIRDSKLVESLQAYYKDTKTRLRRQQSLRRCTVTKKELRLF